MGVQEIPSIVDGLRRAFDGGRTRPLAWRRKQLLRMRAMLREHEEALGAALHQDLGRSRFESWVSEFQLLEREIDHALKHLGSWTRPRKVPTPLALQPAASEVRSDPLGVVLVIAPWNYPVQLSLGPMIPALAAGNCVLLKPSEIAPASSALLADLVPRYLDTACVTVVEGAVPETTALLEQRFDHIFYTGGEQVGRIVMTAAARHLTPVTLELGGKSPVIVDQKVRMKVAARRIAWGKTFNAGQACVAPDYVLVHESRRAELLEELQASFRRFFGDDASRSPDLARIVSDRHFQRVVGLMEGQQVYLGGEYDAETRYVAPTVLLDPDPDSPVMREEIFGPILPVITYQTLGDAIRFVNARPKPLALYLFSDDPKVREQVVSSTTSGGVGVNQVVMHLTVPDLPFGGVGTSGMGAYHGKAGFDTFSHSKSVFTRGTRFDPDVVYPPMSPFKVKWARRLL